GVRIDRRPRSVVHADLRRIHARERSLLPPRLSPYRSAAGLWLDLAGADRPADPGCTDRHGRIRRGLRGVASYAAQYLRTRGPGKERCDRADAIPGALGNDLRSELCSGHPGERGRLHSAAALRRLISPKEISMRSLAALSLLTLLSGVAGAQVLPAPVPQNEIFNQDNIGHALADPTPDA